MLIRLPEATIDRPRSCDITPQSLVLNRRHVLQTLAAAGALGGLGSQTGTAQASSPQATPVPLPGVPSRIAGAVVMDKPTSYQDATTYNNFYEFGTDKADPA